jgi:hypothetical protein
MVDTIKMLISLSEINALDSAKHSQFIKSDKNSHISNIREVHTKTIYVYTNNINNNKNNNSHTTEEIMINFEAGMDQ